uniref:YSIRK-type signal peptide-containing protein n=1 Tax=uncultured Gemella sp. TaxID=254352 RepID=UPI0028D0DF2D
MRYQYKNGEKLTRFSIRKYHFGAASVAVASLIFFGGGMSAKAENIPTSENAQVSGKSADGSSSGDKNSKIDDKSTSAQDKSTIVEKTSDVVATMKVDKVELKKLIISLDTLFRSTEKDKIASIYDEVSQSISEAKLVLDKDTASAEEVNAQVEKLTEVIRKLKETVVKADKTTEKAQEESRQVGEKKTVDNKANTSEKIDKQAETSTLEKKESENKKSTAPDKGKLETLAKSLDVYLKSASEITRPETKELLKGVEETVLSVKKGLENPQLTASEIEELMKQGKQAEKKLALAVSRENSGKRDSRNGINIRPESYFRASYYRAADGKVYDSHGDDRLTEATVGYITKANDGSGYPPGTFLYISHNDNSFANGRNNADLGQQPVKRLKQKVFAEVTKQSNGYHWKITYNNARESRQNPIYYFTIPTGQSIQNMKLFENGAVVKQGGVREVFNGASDKYLTSVGSPDTGVNGTAYYQNVANTQNGIVGNRGGIYGLDDFVKNNTGVYFNRDGMTEEDKTVTNKLYDKIKSSTQNVFAFRPRDFDRGNTYVVEFDTVGNTEAPLYYIAGMKSYEKIPTGRFMHKSYQQWYGVQERYNITVDTSRLKTTFLKGTGIGTLDTKAGLASSAVTIEDTYTNTRFNPGARDIGEYNTYKSTGNYSKDYYKQFHNRFVRDFRGGEDGINVTADRSKGNHTLYIEADVRNQRINFRLPYKVVTQSDIYQPVAKAATGVKDYTGNLGSASDYITEYRYNSVPGFKEPDSYDLGTPSEGLSFYKDRIFDFPKTSARIKEQSVKSVEWVGGTNDLTTGTRIIELTVENGRKELFKVPYYIDVVPGGKISAENVEKLNAAIREAYQKVDTNGNVLGTVPTVTSTTPVWVQKQI